MENASKALIIAGAILLSILIIGLGMAVYNNAKSAMGTANLDAAEVKAHNSQFLAYEGRQKGSEAKALISAIRANNKEYLDRQIKVTFTASTTGVDPTGPDNATAHTEDVNAAADYTKWSKDIKNTTTYWVSFCEGDNGCINGVEIHIYSSDK